MIRAHKFNLKDDLTDLFSSSDISMEEPGEQCAVSSLLVQGGGCSYPPPLHPFHTHTLTTGSILMQRRQCIVLQHSLNMEVDLQSLFGLHVT